MDRKTQFLRRLQRLIPGGPSLAGWNLQRQHIAAQALSETADQAEKAERQLGLGATVDPNTLQVSPDGSGAAGPYLDVWGATMGVPRAAAEPDVTYRRRIVLEHVRCASNNVGMAGLFDDVLSTNGTRVEDSADWLKTSRYGSRTRMNSGARIVGFEDPLADTPATFCVLLAGPDMGHLTRADAARIIARRKAAGTALLLLATDHPERPLPERLPAAIGVSRFGTDRSRFNQARAYCPTQPNVRFPQFSNTARYNDATIKYGQSAGEIPKPPQPVVQELSVVSPGSAAIKVPFRAHIASSEPGAEYQWAVRGGEITSGQGSADVFILASAPGTVFVQARQTFGPGTGRVGSGSTAAVAGAKINVDAVEVHAGESGHVAWVDTQAETTIHWYIQNGVIEQGQGTGRIAFTTGEANPDYGAETVIECLTIASNGVPTTSNASVDILPHPYIRTIITAPLEPGATENRTVDLGRTWLIQSISTDFPARIRLYDSAEHRDSDAGRITQANPRGIPGLLAEVVTTLEYPCIPMHEWAYGTTLDLAYVSIVATGEMVAPIVLNITERKDS